VQTYGGLVEASICKSVDSILEAQSFTSDFFKIVEELQYSEPQKARIANSYSGRLRFMDSDLWRTQTCGGVVGQLFVEIGFIAYLYVTLQT